MSDGARVADAASEASRLSTGELVALVAGLMACNALAIDIMLPALPDMGRALNVVDDNHRQYVVISYVLGLGVAQLFFGPLSDRFGRRRPLLFSLVGYAAFGAACVLAPTFELLVLARTLQGLSAAGARVTSLSLVRDLHSGRPMARIMSLVMMVFMVVPMLAPSIGQQVLFLASWRWIFGVLVLFGLGLVLWVALRLPETLPPERRVQSSLGAIVAAYGQVLRTRVSAGYVVASGIIFGSLFAYISTSEQIYSGVFDKGESFTLYFASAAGGMGVASFLNSRLVENLGMRRLSHGALLVFMGGNLAERIAIALGGGSFALFHGMVMLSFFCMAFIGANFNALAMEPLGRIAGTAAAVLGFVSTFLAGSIGALIGQQFDGTVSPLVTGFAVLGGLALAVVFVTERGRLFQD